LTVTFSDLDTAACSLSADNDAVSYDDLIAGQEFTVTVAQNFTATTSTSSGTYNNEQDTTYIIEVTKGGDFSASPEITVTTTNGVDQSGPHVVTGTGVSIAIGTRGVEIEFGASSALNKGDRFYVEVEGIGSGPVRTIVLAQSLATSFAAGDEVGIDLYIRKPDLEVPLTAPASPRLPTGSRARPRSRLSPASSLMTPPGPTVAWRFLWK